MDELVDFDSSIIKRESNRLFDLDVLPESSIDISNVTYEINKNVVDTYVALTQSSLDVLNYCCDNYVLKPLTVYYFFYYLELYFKTYLLINYPVNVFDVDRYEHDFTGIVKYIKDNSSINFEGFYERLKRFKDKDGNTVNYSKFSDFKYNRTKDSEQLIFDLALLDEDIKNIKDVIVWLENHM